MNEIKKYIMLKLMHNPNLKFNQILNKKFPSNNFAYHIKQMEKNGFIKKINEKYHLTKLGKKKVAYIESKTGKKTEMPLLGVILFAIKDNKVLLLQRKREPFYNIWGGHGARMRFNQYPEECAVSTFKKETGLDCDVKLKGLFISKTFSNDVQLYNHQQFVFICSNLKGKLIRDVKIGKNKWFLISKLNTLDIFPDVPKLIDACLKNKFTIIEADRYIDDDKFTNIVYRKQDKIN